ncbi:MAG: hypothetical protein R3E53_03655 [Myxococcota bacterium]
MRNWATTALAASCSGSASTASSSKKDSPSCGAHRVRVYDEHVKDGVRLDGLGRALRSRRA